MAWLSMTPSTRLSWHMPTLTQSPAPASPGEQPRNSTAVAGGAGGGEPRLVTLWIRTDDGFEAVVEL